MGLVGGPRHYGGEEGLAMPRAQRWICPGCGGENLGPLEGGCPKCQAEAMRLAAAANSVGNLAEQVLNNPDSPLAGKMIRAEALTEKARLSVATALAYLADQGMVTEEMLPKAVMIAWARELAGVADE